MPVMIIVDDESDVAQFLRVTFRLAGFEAYAANNAEECMERIKQLGIEKVDVVCMDGKIASDRGAMLIVKIKKTSNNSNTNRRIIKIFVIADRYLEETKTRILDYGADEFVLKPISLTTIVEKVNALLLESNTAATATAVTF